jgi:hypothetical protein
MPIQHTMPMAAAPPPRPGSPHGQRPNPSAPAATMNAQPGTSRLMKAKDSAKQTSAMTV